MKLRSIVLLASLLALLAVPVAQATVQFSHPYDPNSTDAYQSFYASAGDGVYQGFTDYYWDGGFSITDFHWWGVPLFGNENIAGFQFQIYDQSAASGLPGNLLYDEFFAGDNNATFVETNVNYGFDVYSYWLDLTVPFMPTAPGYLWFSVYAIPANSDLTAWHWAFGNGLAFQEDWVYDFDGSSGWQNLSYYGADSDYAFEITGGEVPEPTTLALFGIGLVGMAIRRFRK